ncbi:MAG: right-handed parallel beta-helix repeat-containing protein [Clostridia bacterium]|nr:right-handed parallel beta-helix repeat-containing protein [Clostridia bacterium]
MTNKIVFYVNPTAALGGDGSKEAPFRSLVFAWAMAKERLKTPGTEITLSLSEGEHVIDETLTLNGRYLPDDSALSLVGVPGKTTVSSLVPIDASLFEKVGENLYAAKLPNVAAFRYLYVDGKIATLAHSGGRNTDDPDMHTMRYNRDANFKDGGSAIAQRKVYLHMDLVKPLIGDRTSGMVWLDNGENIEWHIDCEWNYNIIHMIGIDLDDTVEFDCETIKDKHYANYYPGKKELLVGCLMKRGEYEAFSLHPGYPTENRMYHLASHQAFIRKENDYYYNARTETLYYYTEGDITARTFACPQLDQLFSCRAVKNLSFYGITFTGADNMHLTLAGHNGGQACAEASRGDFPQEAAFYSKSATNLSFENCCFYELGCEGIRLGGRVTGFIVKNCTFRGLGSTAIRSGEPKLRKFDKEDGTENALIENNLIEDTGREYYEAPGIMFAACKDVTIVHNTIRRVPYTGISIGWCWGYNPCPHGELINLTGVYIAYNYVTDYMYNLADGGAIYTLGGNAPRTDHTLYNKTEGNVVVMSKHTGSGRGVCLMGMYYDGASTNWHSYKNVVVAQSTGADYDEENPGYDERFLWTFHERRRRSVYYFAQDYGAYGANNWSYNILNEDCYLIRPRQTEPYALNLELNYLTMGEAVDIVSDDDAKEAILREPMPKDLSFKERLLWKRRNAGARDVFNKDMKYIYAWDALPREAAELITTAGCDGAHPDLDELKADRY